MISKADILERASEWQLTPEVVEKDYVLGWLLVGIAQHPATTTAWVFKGGTCLKKCVMETYRFSEDLDFSLLPEAVYTQDGIEAVLREIAARVTQLSGIRFPAGGLTVKPRQNLAGLTTFEVRVEYGGPLAFPGSPKIRLDLTQHEPVLRTAERRAIFHPYPDKLPADAAVTAYTMSELVAEKTRALCERTRPRDLYDVVLLGDADVPVPAAHELRTVAREKFAVKGVPFPRVADVVTSVKANEELRSEWENMLGHQLPATPPLDDFVGRLPVALAWMDEPSVARVAGAGAVAPLRPKLQSVPGRPGEVLVATAGIRTWGVGAPLEAVRYAGASHLLVEFLYHGARRRIEPYSLRRPGTENLLLYGYEQSKNGFPTNHIKSYNVAEIQGLRVLNTAFTPRYAIELTERGGVWRW